MESTRVAGITWADLRDWGSVDLGFNATGVVQSSVHVEGDELIVQESMPAHFVQDIMDSVAAFSGERKRSRPGGKLVGQVPITLYYQWLRDWQRGPKLWGIPWKKHFERMFTSSDYCKFRIRQN